MLGLCVLCDVRCSTPHLRQKAAEQITENERAAAIVDAWLPAGPDRDAVKAALKRSSQVIKDQSGAIVEAEQKAEKAESDAGNWQRLVWAFRAVVLAVMIAAAFYLWRKLRG
ncbi:MAG: hypothetical protein OHK0011_19440 [Turneriella sp.]